MGHQLAPENYGETIDRSGHRHLLNGFIQATLDHGVDFQRTHFLDESCGLDSDQGTFQSEAEKMECRVPVRAPAFLSRLSVMTAAPFTKGFLLTKPRAKDG